MRQRLGQKGQARRGVDYCPASIVPSSKLRNVENPPALVLALAKTRMKRVDHVSKTSLSPLQVALRSGLTEDFETRDRSQQT